MELNGILLWIAYFCLFIFVLWIFGRIIVWCVAKFMRVWFKIDIVVASVGIFCANGISVRVNDLQSLEIDKVSLKLKPKSSPAVSLHFGDVRIRAERNLSGTVPVKQQPIVKKNSIPNSLKIMQWFARHISLNIDALNIMVLNAFIPESLLHLDVSQVSISGGNKDVVQKGVADSLTKNHGHRVHEEMTNKSSDITSLGLMLSVGEIRGKILKSNKSGSTGTTCIVEVTSSLKIGLVASSLRPNLRLEYVGVDFDKLAVELHSSAFIPGLLLPRPTNTTNVNDLLDITRRTARKPSVPLRQSGPIRTALMLPMLTQCRLSNLDILLFGDSPPLAGIMSDSHSTAERVLHFSVSAATFSQRKDPDRMVTVSTAGFANSQVNDEVIELPTGYIRAKIEDFNVTNLSKMKMITMSRISAEIKMTSNCVLSSSLDFTLCYIHYIHKELAYWTELFKHKVSNIKRDRPHVTFADSLPPCRESFGRPPPARKIQASTINSSKGEGSSTKEIPPQRSFVPSHKRTRSAPNNFYHADEYYYASTGTTTRRPELAVPKDLTSLVQVLNALGISTVCEFTFYEAVIDATLPKPISSSPDKTCGFSFGFDCVTMSVDHSANSQDINFMMKLDRICWKPKNNSFKESSVFLDSSQNVDTRWNSLEATPYHKTDVHDWGTAFSLDTLRLHGQATFGPAIGSAGINNEKTSQNAGSFWPRQHVAISVDAKAAGTQIELSQTAAQCIACILSCVNNSSNDETKFNKTSMLRQTSLATSSVRSDPHKLTKLEKYSFSLAFAEVEVSHINMFILPSDTTGCVDCLIMRIDSLRTEVNLKDRRLNIEGVGVSTVPNPYFSAFASYESGYSDQKGSKLRPVPLSVRQQQTKVSQYQCISVNDMQPLHAAFNAIDLEYKVIEREEPEDEQPSSIQSLSISLNHDRDVTISWSPKLHMLIHHELVEMFHILKQSVVSSPRRVKINPGDGLPKTGNMSPQHKKQARNSYCAPSDLESSKSKMSSAGDGPSVSNIPVKNSSKQITITSNSRICLNLALKDDMNVEFIFNPIRYTELHNVSKILFSKAQVLMDGHTIFSFMNVRIELSARNEKIQRDRATFNDLTTECNRAWAFNLSHWSCHFPHGYDFAATFDQFVTTFKWVKGLYRKTSHPFRSPKLPPDLLIVIDKFIFDIADWDFECRLRDNHELMKDEWRESEKRRKILDQRVTDLRRERGEFLPAKKIEELYIKLEEENTRIYVDRCKKLHTSKEPTIIDSPSWKTHSRSCSVPLQFPSSPVNHSYEPNLSPVFEEEFSVATPSQIRSSSFSFGVTSEKNVDSSSRLYPPLFTWSISSLTFSVLADQSMHGMDNAVETIKNIDKVSPFPQMKTEDSDGYDFVTLWCRSIRLHAGRHQCRIRNYPQYLMDVGEWKIWGKFCGAEQKGSPTAQRTEYVPLPQPWGPGKVNRNMPALKFYYDWSSDVQSFSMAWGPCWDPAWSQVNLAINLLNHPSVDPSNPLSWWDKSRIIFHGRLMMSMDRSSLLQLASLDPYNTTEHMHWDWKSVLMDWTNGNFLFKGDLDIHIRNASKYDDIRFLHLPGLRMEWDITWLCKEGVNPDDHHSVEPCAPDKVPGDITQHDSFANFRSENINLSVSLEVNPSKSIADEDNRNPEILFYSTTLRWLRNFATAINGVTRPVCKGAIFNNHSAPKLKLSRHYKNNTLSFKFPSLKMRYWSSYAQQLGIEWKCGEGSIVTKFQLTLVPFEGILLRRSAGNWSLVQATCELSQTKVYLIKQTRKTTSQETQDNIDEISQLSSSSSSVASNHEQTASTQLGTLESNFLLSLSHMAYRLENNSQSQKSTRSSANAQSSSNIPPTPMREHRSNFQRDKRQRTSQRNRRQQATPRKPPSQHRHHLVVHDLRAMWTTDNRDVGFGLYEGYNKAAILKHNLSTKVLKNILLKPNEDGAEDTTDGSRSSSASSFRSQRSSVSTSYSEYSVHPPVSPGEKLMQSANLLLNKLLSDTDNRFVVGTEVPGSDKEQLNGVSACQMDDVMNQNWRIKFFNCQAMLKGPKTQGYIILTAAEADLINREHKIAWRDSQLTSKSTWMGSLNDMQIFATVERNVHSSGQDGENVPWLTATNIEPRGPSPGMLDISDLMTGGQAIGGVVGDGVSAGSFQLQRIMSRCSCRMYYIGYELIVDSEETDYGQLLTSPSHDHSYQRLPEFDPISEESSDLLGKEKPVNTLTVVQHDLEICTNNTQYSMILDIVENLLLYVEPGMREHWERVDRMRFQLQLTSLDDVARHREALTKLQDEIRQRLNHIRQLERDLFKVDRLVDKDPSNEKLISQSVHLRNTLINEKETLKEDSEELGIFIRCFKELYLQQKTRLSSVQQASEHEEKWDEEAAVARRTEVSFGQVKWHLTDADGQLTIAKFELRNFVYEKINKSDDSLEHHFELGWLWLQNLLPNSVYVDVLKPQGDQAGANSYTVVGSGSQRLALRALCKVRPPVGGISVKEHLELNVVPLIIQLTDQFFKRMMLFFFPGKNSEDVDQEDHTASKDNLNATLLGLSSSATNSQGTLKPKVPSPPKKKSSNELVISFKEQTTPGAGRKNWRHNHGGKFDVADDVDKMKERAAKNNTFLYIKIPQFPIRVSYKGEKEKNIEDVRDFNLTIPMFVYHNMTWTWHDLAMAIKRDCKRTLLSQVIKEKFHLGSSRGSHKEQQLSSGASSRSSSSLPAAGMEADVGDHKKDEEKFKMLFGNSLKRSESHRKSFKKGVSMFRKKK
uniref:protein KIAA0100-like isoform X1 n=1 Tax=Styela clava TaxID=7725 RepID=UPI00193A5CDF|nr:protein KIAA0100-like isoform X1 [Styela clava]